MSAITAAKISAIKVVADINDLVKIAGDAGDKATVYGSFLGLLGVQPDDDIAAIGNVPASVMDAALAGCG